MSPETAEVAVTSSTGGRCSSIQEATGEVGAWAGAVAGGLGGLKGGVALGALTGPAAPICSPLFGAIGLVGGGIAGAIWGEYVGEEAYEVVTGDVDEEERIEMMEEWLHGDDYEVGPLTESATERRCRENEELLREYRTPSGEPIPEDEIQSALRGLRGRGEER